MSKLLAIAFSDLHIDEWSQFNKDNRRLKYNLNVLDYLNKLAIKKEVPLLFTGDLFNNPRYLTNGLLELTLPVLKTIQNFYGIDGNHDQSQQNTHEHFSPSYINTFSKVFDGINCINYKTVELNNIVLHGIPYLTHNIGFKETLENFQIIKGKKNILMIHTDLPSAKDALGREVNSHSNIPDNMKKFFKRFDLVLAGHIHLPQQLGDNIFMLGPPQQQVRSDSGCQMGFWKIYENNMKFTYLNNYPEFKYFNEGEEHDDYNFWTMIPKPKEKSEEKTYVFNNTQNRSKIASKYCKKKGISDKGKVKLLKKVLKDS